MFDLRDILQNLQSIRNRTLQQVGNGIAPVFHGERLVIVAPASTNFAKHVHVGQEIHLYATLAFALARFTPPSGYVERESARLVAAFAGFRQHGIQIADLGEDSGVGGWVGARSAPDRRLVDANDLVDMLGAGDRLVRAGFLARPIKLLGQGAIQNVVHQGRFSGA